jgi:hypothetical protein
VNRYDAGLENFFPKSRGARFSYSHFGH